MLPHFLRKNLPLAALAAITLLAGGLRFWKLNALGYGNYYYAAAVKGMLKSWHNFLFAAAEPGGSVSVDKPPVGFWLQTLSARLLGVNSLGLFLPQALTGILSVLVLYALVRQSYGKPAGLLAALALAVTPVAVATDRNNTIDSTLVLTLLLAAWAFIKATQTGKLRHLLLGTALVGIGFNIKMLEAYLPLPAFLALYFVGARQRLRRKVGNLTLAVGMLLAVSLLWPVMVDLTPASQRPYVGGSSNNRELSLIVGYNGLQRLFGLGRNGPGGGQSSSMGNVAPPPPGMIPPAEIRLGVRGSLRLLQVPLSKEASWLLPLALFGAICMAARAPLRWPAEANHQALVLWGGWLVTAGAFFSAAGYFHEYYLYMLAAPIAALTAIGIVQVWELRARRGEWSIALLLVAAGATAQFQVRTASPFIGRIPWLPETLALLGVGAVLLIAEAPRTRGWISAAGFLCLAAALLIAPGAWSVLTAIHTPAANPWPSAYNKLDIPFTDSYFQADPAQLAYLEAHTQDTYYMLAVPSSVQGSGYVLASGRPVLYLGGFNGYDPVVSAQDLTALLRQGRLRYILADDNEVASLGKIWDASTCKPVQGFSDLYDCGD